MFAGEVSAGVPRSSARLLEAAAAQWRGCVHGGRWGEHRRWLWRHAGTGAVGLGQPAEGILPPQPTVLPFLGLERYHATLRHGLVLTPHTHVFGPERIHSSFPTLSANYCLAVGKCDIRNDMK